MYNQPRPVVENVWLLIMNSRWWRGKMVIQFIYGFGRRPL